MPIAAAALSRDIVSGAALTVLCVGIWVAGTALRRGAPPAERLMAGLLAVVALGWITMLQPLLGVSFVSQRTLLGIVLAAALVAAAVRLRGELVPRALVWPPLAAGAVAAAAVAIPYWRAPTIYSPIPDMFWHEGWIRQLVAGFDEPGAIYHDVPNAYPWLYHALAAWFIQLLPGGMLSGLVLVEAFGLLLLGTATWLLARELGLDTAEGTWAVFLAIGAGGVGWIWIQHATAVFRITPRHLAQHHGDFVVANALTPALGNIPPLLPRELGLALVPATLWLGLRALHERSRLTMALAGAATGWAFLTGPLGGAVAVASLLALAVARRDRLIAYAAPPAALVSLTWIGPLLYHYLDLGGFISITRKPAYNPALGDILVSLGIVVPLAAAGAVMLAQRREGIDRRALSALVATPLAMCLAAAVLGRGSAPLGAPALVRLLRYLPYVDLMLMLPAAVAATRIARRWATLRVPITLAIALAAIATPTLAAVRTTHASNDASLVPRFRCSAPLPVGAEDTVAVAGLPPVLRDAVSAQLFLDTGAATLYRAHPRIRYREIYTRIPSQRRRHAILRRIAAGQPAPTWVGWAIRPAAQASASGGNTVRCRYAGRPLAVQRLRS
jgi:hypothetical protein